VVDSREADEIAAQLARCLSAKDSAAAFEILVPVLEQRTPFRLLDRIAVAAGTSRWPETIALLDRIAAAGREGGWVIIGQMLWRLYAGRPEETISECRRYILAADAWYGADILAERVPGRALVQDFATAVDLLAPWRSDANRWARRALGVAVHFWAKRSRGGKVQEDRAQVLLDFLAPMFEEKDMDAVKGVGWGLKTLGRHYPDQASRWLLAQAGRPHRRLMLRKALTYLPAEERRSVLEGFDL
jgi:3-methyladenine DNA glycosylase AlkD